MRIQCRGEACNRAVRQQCLARIELRHIECELPRELIRFTDCRVHARNERRAEANLRIELLLLARRVQLTDVLHVGDLPVECTG